MSSIPLVALSVRPPSVPDPLEQLGRIGALKQQQQSIQAGNLENQQRQMAMRDEQAMTAAMTQWDGSDPNQLPGLVIKSGGSAKAVLGLKSQLLAQRKSYSEIAKDDAETGKNTTDTQIKLKDQMAGLIGNVLSVPDDQLPAAVQQAGQQAVQQGLLDPAHAQAIGQLTQMPPDQMRQKLTFLQKSYMGQKAQQEAAGAELLKQKATEDARHNQAMETKPTDEQRNFGDFYQTFREAKGLPDTPKTRLQAEQEYYKTKQPYGAARLEIAREGLNLREDSAGRKDTDFIDKNYVKPANDVEKSYQMFLDAYNNRNNAKTGAESMLALSTHLATTFGNVKGARVTKDMIEHHLGARGIGDSALVAVQKLTNGDVLSPDQWDAFKGLISQSRNLTWQTAAKEAKRRQVDIKESLPADVSASESKDGDFFSTFGGKPRR